VLGADNICLHKLYRRKTGQLLQTQRPMGNRWLTTQNRKALRQQLLALQVLLSVLAHRNLPH
jgi:deoxyribodipyrimidine photolyase-like uncharacterized protein